jgi:formamidopyrimidine-DNA glycosylase
LLPQVVPSALPELPDVTLYVEALRARVLGQPLEAAALSSPFLLRTVAPPLADAVGRSVTDVRRVGKRVVLVLDNGVCLAMHLMVAGRLHWRKRGTRGRAALAAFDFPGGTLTFTEAGSRHRAALHVLREGDLATLDAGGVEPLEATPSQLAAALRRENHTLKRALTDPRLVAGIGNAYSDEILHRARLSPVLLTSRLSDEDAARLHAATREVLVEWTNRLRGELEGGFPERVTAFRDDFAMHGRFGKPCPDCGTTVQRIVRGENESNYCPRCQTGGKLLADRALSRLLHDDWPRTIDEWEQRRMPGQGR